jgi:hypothetical protein
MRYWYLNIHIQCGEHEFHSQSYQKTKGKEEFDSEDYAKDFYGMADDPDNDDGSYYFDCGNLCVEVYVCKEITKKEYDVLTKIMR